jgi:DNA polymerase V
MSSKSDHNNIFPENNTQRTFALVDCNNFYASCERVFYPKLREKPVIVLSNNDGCVIARSDEAKLLGIKMGAPAFEFNDIIEKEKVFVFSANYALYGDISARVMNTISSFSPEVEIYSIDEAFIDLSENKEEDAGLFAARMLDTIRKWTGMPVSVGIGRTKTQAKVANYVAKRNPEYNGICDLSNTNDNDGTFQTIPIEELWGIGRVYGKFLRDHNITNLLDFKNADENWVRNHLHVIGQKTLLELRGISCISLENDSPDKQSICSSRSFGKPLTQFEDIEQATSTFVSMAAAKLRRQKSCARAVFVFLMTNRFSTSPKYVNSISIQLPVATNITSELIHYAIKGLKKIYRKGYLYKKSGVVFTDLIPEENVQAALWDILNREKLTELMSIVDKINSGIGKGSLKFAIQGTKRKWKMKQERLSPSYTGNWNDILKIKL